MADLFAQKDIIDLFSNKFIIMLGDSNMRAMYKDLVYLLNRGKMTPAHSFRGRHDQPFCGDVLLKCTNPSQGRGYHEIRQFEDRKCNLKIRYQFITQVYGKLIMQLCTDLETGEVSMPQVLIINSCMWDLTRWGPYQENNYKGNVIKLCCHLRKILPDDTLVLWTTTPPVSSEHVKGGVLIKQLDFIQHSMRFMFMEANSFVHQVCVAFDFDILDLHYWMRFQLNRRTVDGLHWEPHAMRFITNLLLTHISLAFEEPLPNNFSNRSLNLSNSKKKATEALNGLKVDINLSKEVMEDIFEKPSSKHEKTYIKKKSVLERFNPKCKDVSRKGKEDLDKQQREVESALERVSLRARRRLIDSKDKELKQESSKEKRAEINNIDEEFIRAKYKSFIQEEKQICSKRKKEIDYITEQKELRSTSFIKNTFDSHNQASSSMNYTADQNRHNTNYTYCPSNQYASVSSTQLHTNTTRFSQNTMPQNVSHKMSNNSQMNILSEPNVSDPQPTWDPSVIGKYSQQNNTTDPNEHANYSSNYPSNKYSAVSSTQVNNQTWFSQNTMHQNISGQMNNNSQMRSLNFEPNIMNPSATWVPSANDILNSPSNQYASLSSVQLYSQTWVSQRIITQNTSGQIKDNLLMNNHILRTPQAPPPPTWDPLAEDNLKNASYFSQKNNLKYQWTNGRQ